MDKLFFFLKRFIPKRVFIFFQPFYHRLLAFLAAVVYGFPSRGMKVIGVTGTSGKTTTIEFLYEIFTEAGLKTASASGLWFRIGNEKSPNNLKMTMPGRFRIQKFLREARRNGAEYVFLEVTSEGIKQYRHTFIKFYAAILTNLSPEHIESHGGFEKYRSAKAELFKIAPLAILNGNDPNFEYFYKILARDGSRKEKIVFVENDFPRDLVLKMPGEFNKMNAVAALTFAKHEGIRPDTARDALSKIGGIEGRMEYLNLPGGRDFKILIDYAFLPQVLEKVYEEAKSKSEGLVCVLGGTGGGRDKWKRPKLGDVAAKYCRKVFVTNEDPYDEDPMEIINQVAGTHDEFEKILDRREAIRTALKETKPGETVVITGKGAEPWIMGPGGGRIAWDDRKIAMEELEKFEK
ncbi:hypothetical protein HYT00_03425 [Candidatus Giovannonibacteria bacterium]|nr:hypothetical protein [Candidatus Giovannonibacteria bacterium]